MDVKTEQAHAQANRALEAGVPFDRAVKDAFSGNHDAMRQYIRTVGLADLRRDFKAADEKIFATPMDSFLAFATQWRQAAILSQARQKPIAAAEEAVSQIEMFLRLAQSMKQSDAPVSAMVIEERIDQDFIQILSDADQRNKMRGLLYGYQFGAYR